MKTNFIIFCFAILISPVFVFSQTATITESFESFKTYPYSDPDPVARITKFYPYYRFDGFTNNPENKKWKIITLENEYIKVFVAPEIGGKVLGAIDKSTGEEFIYFNKVMKFRDISMRGAWTSGGIEFNFGSIGHAPTTASPVNYLMKENSDGSVSCIVGAPDITSRTEWRVEIRLESDKSYFETNAIWYNPSNLESSLYNWMTASVDASYDLEYYFPGNIQIGHSGDAHPWPVNEKGIDVSYYKNNNFDGAKSYHVLGEYAEHFLCYFRNKDFGLGHWSPYDEKPGQKIWLWALSREGEIWADLLTDPGNIQYSEIQTGLLFNQAAQKSAETPYKHLFFEMGAEHKFRELWFPVKKIGGMVKANEYGSLNVEQNGRLAHIGFCANRELSEELIVFAGGKEVLRRNINLKPTEVFIDSVEIGRAEDIEVKIGTVFSFNTEEIAGRVLSKPSKINEGYDWESVDAIFTAGLELEKQRLYAAAEEKYSEVLKKDRFHTRTLARMAGLQYRKMQYNEAKGYALKALANDTYDPEANYIFGLISNKLGNKYDALDAFSLAARSMGLRSVANVQIATIKFVDGEMQRCLKYANKAIDYNRNNINALKLKALVYEKTGKQQYRNKTLNDILAIDPLNTFARFEKGDGFAQVLNYEMPNEICLEQAISYYNLGLEEKAVRLLKKSNQNPITDYWLAYILKDSKYLDRAVAASPEFVYPSRCETEEVLQWATMQNSSWKTKYYLGLINWSKGRIEKAKQYFNDCGNQPDFFAFYLARYKILNSDPGYTAENDLTKARELAPDQWRCYKALSDYYEVEQKYELALEWSGKGFAQFPGNYVLAYQSAKNLLFLDRYEEALEILTNTNILPNEGARSGRVTYWQASVMDAIEKFKKNKNRSALSRIDRAREWPENLGVGKPYNTDERVEDFLESIYWQKNRKNPKAKILEDKIVAYTLHATKPSAGHYLGALILKKRGRENEAQKLLMKWVEDEPDNLVAGWCLAKFEGNIPKAEEILEEVKKQNGGTLFNPRNSDTSFALVLAISEM